MLLEGCLISIRCSYSDLYFCIILFNLWHISQVRHFVHSETIDKCHFLCTVYMTLHDTDGKFTSISVFIWFCGK